MVQQPIRAPFCLEKAHPLNTLVQVLDAVVGTGMVSHVSHPEETRGCQHHCTTKQLPQRRGDFQGHLPGDGGAGVWTQPRSSYILRPPYYTASRYKEELTAADAPVSQVGWSKEDAKGVLDEEDLSVSFVLRVLFK